MPENSLPNLICVPVGPVTHRPITHVSPQKLRLGGLAYMITSLTMRLMKVC